MVYCFKFADLIILYPLTNLSLVWSPCFVKRVFGESISPTRLLGTFLIVIGCFVLVL